MVGTNVRLRVDRWGGEFALFTCPTETEKRCTVCGRNDSATGIISQLQRKKKKKTRFDGFKPAARFKQRLRVVSPVILLLPTEPKMEFHIWIFAYFRQPAKSFMSVFYLFYFFFFF